MKTNAPKSHEIIMAKHYETDHDYFSKCWAESNAGELVLRVQTKGTKQIKDEVRVLLHSLQDVIDLEAAVKSIREVSEDGGRPH